MDNNNIIDNTNPGKAEARSKDKNGNTPLILALFYGDKEAAAHLIEQGEDVNAKNIHGNTPLILAADKGFRYISNLLIEKGADVNASILLPFKKFRENV